MSTLKVNQIIAPKGSLDVYSHILAPSNGVFASGAVVDDTLDCGGLVTLTTGTSVFTGSLSCATPPTLPQHLANKTYVDATLVAPAKRVVYYDTLTPSSYSAGASCTGTVVNLSAGTYQIYAECIFGLQTYARKLCDQGCNTLTAPPEAYATITLNFGGVVNSYTGYAGGFTTGGGCGNGGSYTTSCQLGVVRDSYTISSTTTPTFTISIGGGGGQYEGISPRAFKIFVIKQ